MNLEKLFNPKSVAVIGASASPEKLGHALVKNLLGGSSRRVYPINPHEKKILGQKCYDSILKVPGRVDLAIVALKAEVVASVLSECGKKKIPYAIVISAGFKESGEKGRELEKEIQRVAKKYKIKLVGPNCLGIVDLHTRLNASFAADISEPGGVAFLSQSGAVGTAMLDWAKAELIGFSKFISFGNEAGLTENDFLEYLAKDKKTKAILMYLEGITDGRRFSRLAKQITKIKPLVVLKAGRSARGAAAVATHTGALAPEDTVFQAACGQSGVVNVFSLRALFNFAKLFNAGVYRPLKNLAIVTNGGGPSIVMADLIDLSPTLELAEISESAKKALRKVLPPSAAVNNPVDLIGDALSDRYESALKILTKEKNIDALVVILTPQEMTDPKGTARVLVKYNKIKPIIPVFMGEAKTRAGEKLLKKYKLGNFDYPKDVEEVLTAFSREIENKKELVVAAAAGKFLDFPQTVKLFKKYGLNLPFVLVKKKNQLAAALRKIKAPAVLKIYSPTLTHKSEAGGVKLNLKSLAEARKAWGEIERSIKKTAPGAILGGMLVSPMLFGREVLIGMKRDRNFGPVVIFGLGGIFTEILQDVSRRVAPVSNAEAGKMMEEVRAYKILAGARGQKAVNLPALKKIILAVARLALEHPEIKSLDLNPVIVNEKQAYLADVRVEI